MADGEDAAIGFTPARILAADIAAKRISPVEVTEAILRHIDRLEPALNAFAHLDREGALASARAAEAAVMQGGSLGPLHGVTVTVKDMMPVNGLPIGRGSAIFAGTIATEDAPIVTRLREAGAVILGKTTTSEFGWSAVSRSPATGITHNPWAPGLNAGASSAGAGVAAAAGFGPLHQGSDGAGSVRLPAHFCGVVGLKPSFGRIPYLPLPNNDYMSHIGPLTRTVDDNALMLGVLAGAHPWEHTTLDGTVDLSPAALAVGVKRLRIGYSPDLGVARVDPDVASLVAAAVRTFESLGAHVETVTPPWGKDGPELIRGLWSAHMAVNKSYLPEWADRMDPGLVACIHSSDALGLQDYFSLRARKYAYTAAIHRWFDDWDLLITPSASVAAFPVERLMPAHWPSHDWDWLSWAEFSYPFNMAQNPAISVPCGFTADGRPVGLQITGRRLDDTGVLRAAAALEAAQPWAQRRPIIANMPNGL
jgi:aspartyl-tRNA(Asn)/glutamyl-tRNA(Gln) amidotransferase subunit A